MCVQSEIIVLLHCLDYTGDCMCNISLVPSPFFFRAGRRAGEKNGPGIYCLRMRQSIWALTFDPGVKTSP